MAKETDNRKEKKKLKIIKQLIRQMVFENAALCDECVRVEEKLEQVIEERKFLLRQLLQYQTAHQESNLAGITPTSSVRLHQSQQSLQAMLSNLTAQQGAAVAKAMAFNRKKQMAKLKDKVKKRYAKKKTVKEVLEENMHRSQDAEFFHSKTLVQNLKDSKNVHRGVTLYAQPIPLDSLGRPKFPIYLGDLTIYSIGEILVDRPTFHTQSHLTPVGFCSTRAFSSVTNPNKKTIYTCKIQEQETSFPKPIFEIVSDENMKIRFVGDTADECHAALLKAIGHGKPEPLFSTLIPSGPSFFGFSHPTIQNLMQNCPGARKCVGNGNYQWVKYEMVKTLKDHTFHQLNGPASDNPSVSFHSLNTLINDVSKRNSS